MSKYKNVTFIEDLFDADSLTQSNSDDMERQAQMNQIKNRHIRKSDINSHLQGINGYPEKAEFQYQPPVYQPQYQPQYQPSSFDSERDLSCMTIASHIKNCPLCSQFYNRNDSVYIISIILLIIACVILVKKILEKS